MTLTITKNKLFYKQDTGISKRKNETSPMSVVKRKKSPLTDKTTETLRELLSKVLPGEKILSEREFSRKFNVSRKILRRSLEVLRREGLVEAKPGKGLYKAEIQKNRNSILGNISIVLALTSIDSYNLEILQTTARESGKHKIKLIAHENTSNISAQKEFLESLLEIKNLQGMITNPPFSREELQELGPVYARLEKSGIQLVFINAPKYDFPVSNVSFDDPAGIGMLVNYMSKLGHKKIAFMTSEIDNYRNQPRLDGYLEAIKNIHGEPLLIRYKWLTETSHLRSAEFVPSIVKMVKNDGITAFIGHNDGIAACAFRELQKAGIRIPEEVSLAGYDRIAHINYRIPVELTSTERDRSGLAVAAFNLLTSKIVSNGKNINDKKTVLPVSIFTGMTCDVKKQKKS